MRAVLICLVWIASLPGVALAHELRPAIGDLSTQGSQVILDIRLNAEAILAGADLTGVEDTNATDASDAIDTLRLLPAKDIETRLRAASEQIIGRLDFTAAGKAVDLAVVDIEAEPTGFTELPRETVLHLAGELPFGAETVEMRWPADYGTLILRQIDVDEGYIGYLAGDSTGPISIQGGDAKGALATFGAYIPAGFDHILPKGLDHILFVLGLFFLSTGLRPLLWQVSAFTLAHTVTLALGALGYVVIPANIVEPIIAASIVYVAVENIVTNKLHRWRPVVIFVFGLLHGLGFASVLQEFGLPQGQFFPALIGFNIGVELGQLTVISIAFGLVWLAQKADAKEASIRLAQVVYGIGALLLLGIGQMLNGPDFVHVMGAGAPVFFWPLAGLCVLCFLAVMNVDTLHAYRRFVAMPASLAIACVGAWWFVERVFL